MVGLENQLDEVVETFIDYECVNFNHNVKVSDIRVGDRHAMSYL